MDLLPYREDATPLVPSAPMDPPPGYPNVGFIDASVSPPPRYEDIYKYFPEHRPEIKGTSVITADEARNALLNHCKSQRCWGSKAAQDMNILSIKTTNAFQYRLESFCEKRTSVWSSVPYTGQLIDGPNNGYPPGPWDIRVQFREKFKSEIKSLEVPHTACVKGCESCRANGFLRCNWCHGHGKSRCTFCHGSGHRTSHGTQGHGSHRERCFTCGGSGQKRCMTCSGTGRIRCKTCQGHCHMKWFIQLNVQWTNNFVDHIHEETDMPDELIKGVSGDIAFHEENVRVFPISHCPIPSINRASADLIARHASEFPNDKIHLQRHTVKLVPVTEVEAHWKNDRFRFFVYGLEMKVFTDNYPQTKCCGCSIL